VLFGLVYVLLRRVVRLLAGSSNDELSTEVELLVLRHQLKVLKRQVGRPRLRRRDRLFMAVIRERPSSCSVVLVPCQPADAPSVAPGAREAEVDHRAEAGRRQTTDPR
jgi:hypothetical protein